MAENNYLMGEVHILNKLIQKKNIMKKKEFKVLVMNPNTHMFETYDILPFLRIIWEDWPYNVSFECGYGSS